MRRLRRWLAAARAVTPYICVVAWCCGGAYIPYEYVVKQLADRKAEASLTIDDEYYMLFKHIAEEDA